jgi:diadenosine tetraphosphatase ApaH/serine/threonine PP2A family protein phosphatase
MHASKYALLGDIHSNLEALNAVLEDARGQGVTDYICVGDVVGYNADPAACLEKVRELCADCVRGNHDHYCSHDESLDDFHPLAANVIDWTRRQLTADQIAYLKGLRLTHKVRGFTIVHSTLDMPDKWGYVFDTLEAEAHFSYQNTSVCFYGHTHVPVIYEKEGRVFRRSFSNLTLGIGKKYFINTGSVGQPRDGDPRAAYVIYAPAERMVELRRIPYDIAATQKKIRAAGLPDRLARRLELGR